MCPLSTPCVAERTELSSAGSLYEFILPAELALLLPLFPWRAVANTLWDVVGCSIFSTWKFLADQANAASWYFRLLWCRSLQIANWGRFGILDLPFGVRARVHYTIQAVIFVLYAPCNFP